MLSAFNRRWTQSDDPNKNLQGYAQIILGWIVKHYAYNYFFKGDKQQNLVDEVESLQVKQEEENTSSFDWIKSLLSWIRLDWTTFSFVLFTALYWSIAIRYNHYDIVVRILEEPALKSLYLMPYAATHIFEIYYNLSKQTLSDVYRYVIVTLPRIINFEFWTTITNQKKEQREMKGVKNNNNNNEILNQRQNNKKKDKSGNKDFNKISFTTYDLIPDAVDTNECPYCLEEFHPIKQRNNCFVRAFQKFKEIGLRRLMQDHKHHNHRYRKHKLDDSEKEYLQFFYEFYFNQQNAGKQDYNPLDYFEKPDEIAQLSCNHKHIFHKECIKKYIQKQGREEKSCPLCREPFKAS